MFLVLERFGAVGRTRTQSLPDAALYRKLPSSYHPSDISMFGIAHGRYLRWRALA